MKWLWGAALSFAVIAGAAAQTYPNRPVRLVVGFPPGSGPDQVARLIGTDLQQQLGQPFVIDNKSGALGTIAAGDVARATPDGYTILMTTNTTGAAAPALVRNLTYDPGKDFTPVMRLVTSPRRSSALAWVFFCSEVPSFTRVSNTWRPSACALAKAPMPASQICCAESFTAPASALSNTPAGDAAFFSAICLSFLTMVRVLWWWFVGRPNYRSVPSHADRFL